MTSKLQYIKAERNLNYFTYDSKYEYIWKLAFNIM